LEHQKLFILIYTQINGFESIKLKIPAGGDKLRIPQENNSCQNLSYLAMATAIHYVDFIAYIFM